jgi:2-polyprenyl-3-methyl-5-hydroxy-6-metoxy-1,4-benzoquinol methylase
MGDSDRSDAATAGADYAARLESRETARWKQVLDVQRPYRWNLRRLGLGRTLDVGCGIGRNLLALDDAVGVDHNASSIEVARQRGARAWSTEEWPTSPDAVLASYDSMLLAHVLEHLDQATADEVVRSYLPFLKPAARLVLICPQEKGYATDHTHVRFVDPSVLDATARRLGFVPTRSYSFPFPRAAGKVFPYNEFVLVAERLS